MKVIRFILLPFGFIYGCIMELRNLFFDWGWLKSVEFDVPVIVVGNLSVGGTGKTPMVKYLLSKLSVDYKVAVLSRGYGRRTKGYRIVQPDSHASETGDEPLEIKRSFENIPVCVCEDRVLGITNLLYDFPEVNLIILDDAFQHRYVRPTFSILLSRASKPFYRDYPMPSGTLREFGHNYKRADVVVFTGNSDNEKHKPLQIPTFTSRPDYIELERVYGEGNRERKVLITGIANPSDLATHAKSHWETDELERFPDHHRYSEKDIEQLLIKHPNHDWLTTEKDWVKLQPLMENRENMPSVFVVRFALRLNDENEFFKLVGANSNSPTPE